ncbi:MAG: hypothetical protein HY719_03150 [Planctomycetes bacterium]|nr:hypothetical protein [Planctomycetota bacterium]
MRRHLLLPLFCLATPLLGGCAVAGDEYLSGRASVTAWETYVEDPWWAIGAPVVSPLALAADGVALPVAAVWDPYQYLAGGR